MSTAIDESAWTSTRLPDFPPLAGDLGVDVLVVGGGITGLTTAYLLAKAGARVALVERRRLMSGDTALTTAHVTPVTDARAHELMSLAGEAEAAAMWAAGRAALRQMQLIINTHGIECGWQALAGYLHVPFDAPADADRDEEAMLRRDAALAHGWGEDAVYQPAVPLMRRSGVRFADQRVVDPARYLRGLAMSAASAGAAIFEESEPVFGSDPERIECRGHRIRAGVVVMATHNPHAGRQTSAAASVLQTKLALYTTFAVRAVAPGGHEPALYWDTGDPYRYLRVDASDEGVAFIAGGSDTKTGQHRDARESADAVERWLHALVPEARVTHRWSGQVIETPDAIPFIGQVGQRQWIATGFAGNGMTFGTLAAMVVRDGVMGFSNPWRSIVSPERASVRRDPWTYVRENLDYPYYMLRRVFGTDAGTTLQQIPRGEGAIVELDGRQVAAARDQRGRLHLRSAVCTHLGCTVRWNGVSRSWDCPCHGSRFSVEGKVLSGPADRSLGLPE